MLGSLVSISAMALAAKDDKAKDSPGAKAVSDYDKAITDAHKSFAASAGGSLDEAISGYRKAITVDPNRPEGHLYLGGALYQKGDYAGADEALTAASNRAKANAAYANFQGKALFLLATLREVEGKTDDAKAAWKTYEDFAKANPDKAYPTGSGEAPPMLVKVYPGSAVERQNKLETYAKSVTEYAKVKEAILKRQKELGIEPTIPKPK